jgi:hypothetical protein
MIERTYTELSSLRTFKERFQYLRLDGTIGVETFGFDRFVNQRFYQSREWHSVRDFVIVRDCGCDLGLDGYEIFGRILIHHMNPISIKDFEKMTRFLLDPEYLICATHQTHNAIHYGDENLLAKEPIERSRNDTCPWKR